MTREDALKKAKHYSKVYHSICVDAEGFWAAVIEALSQEPTISRLERRVDDNTVVFRTIDGEEVEYVRKEPCDDAISRQSAIFLASDLKQDLPDDESIAEMVMSHNEGILEYQTQLSLLPSVTQKLKTGHWILTDDDFVYCSECEDSYYPRPIDASWYYCPHCGAKMVEPQERSE